MAPAEGEPGSQTENQPMPLAESLEAGQRYYMTCFYSDTNPHELYYEDYFVYEPGMEGPLLEQLARQVADSMPLSFPTPVTSPGIDVDQLVGLPTWLWIDQAAWRPHTVEASLAGFSVAVTATPARVEWSLGENDEATVTCAGPGTPWDPALGNGQSTDCSYVFQYVPQPPASTYPASATLVWDVSYAVNGQPAGSLGESSTATTFDLRVTEREAVVCYDTPAEECTPTT